MAERLSSFIITSIAAGGWGVARTPEGVLFARAVLTGEEIRVLSATRRRGILWADAFELVTPSPERIAPACPWFPLCGGCDFHHMTRSAELEAKLTIATETLRRFTGRPIEVEHAAGNRDAPFAEYRNSIRIQGGGGYLGFCRKNSHEIVDIEDCLITRPEIRAEIRRRRATPPRFPVKSLTIRSGLDPATHAPAVTVIATSHQRTRIDGDGLLMRLGARDFRVDPRSFFQVNLAAMEGIIEDLREALPPGPRLLDLCAGVGAIALSLEDRYERIVGCEIARSAVEDFRRNAAGSGKIEILEWDMAQGLKIEVNPDDAIIVDPPRTGMPERLRADLGRARPAVLAYVSCDAATFARDLKDLLDHGYALARPIRIHEMFPRTAHMELVGILRPLRNDE
jgi:23S rRNA (uracil1939-C5)-methyltransferase